MDIRRPRAAPEASCFWDMLPEEGWEGAPGLIGTPNEPQQGQQFLKEVTHSVFSTVANHGQNLRSSGCLLQN